MIGHSTFLLTIIVHIIHFSMLQCVPVPPRSLYMQIVYATGCAKTDMAGHIPIPNKDSNKQLRLHP